MTELDASRDQRIAAAERWCKSIREYAQRSARADDKLAFLRSQADCIKAVRYDRIGGRSQIEHGDDAIVNALSRIDDAVDAVIQATNDLMDESEEFERSLDRMENQSYARLLYLRYAMCWEWCDIAREVPYTYNHLTTYAREAALEQLYDYMPERMRKI